MGDRSFPEAHFWLRCDGMCRGTWKPEEREKWPVGHRDAAVDNPCPSGPVCSGTLRWLLPAAHHLEQGRADLEAAQGHITRATAAALKMLQDGRDAPQLTPRAADALRTARRRLAEAEMWLEVAAAVSIAGG